MNRPLRLLAVCSLVGCAPLHATSPEAGAQVDAIAPVPADVELRDGTGAIISGRPIPMDGLAEGLAWPGLGSAVHRGARAVVVIDVARDVPVSTVLRAVWTLRDANVRLQTSDKTGAVRVLDLRPKPDAATDTGCHLAVFAAANGDLRVASPGGPHVITGADPAGALARALAEERAQCTIRYIAFGADDTKAPWSTVFDVARAVDRGKSAGDARYVLAESIR